MNTREEDDEEFEQLRQWFSGRAAGRERRDPKDFRWKVLLVVVACLAAAVLLAVGRVEAGGTVTDSKYYLLQRSGVTQTPNPTSMTECLARMLERIEQEMKSRTTGYVTYKCLDISQSYVKFSKTVPIVTPPPPVASLQVYACADAGADGRILESATVLWPNCATASYQNPSRSLVVATNDDGVLRWRLASKVTTGRVWTQTGAVGAWTLVGDINWGAVPLPTANRVTWKTPTENVDGTPLTSFMGYKVIYGAAPDALNQTIAVYGAVNEYVFTNLSPGTYYFAVKTWKNAYAESAPSAVIGVTVR